MTHYIVTLGPKTKLHPQDVNHLICDSHMGWPWKNKNQILFLNLAKRNYEIYRDCLECELSRADTLSAFLESQYLAARDKSKSFVVFTVDGLEFMLLRSLYLKFESDKWKVLIIDKYDYKKDRYIVEKDYLDSDGNVDWGSILGNCFHLHNQTEF